MKRSNQGLKTIAMARARTGWFTPRNPSARWGRRSCDAVRRGGLRAGWVSGSSRETSRARGGTMASAARGTDRRCGKGGARDGRASPLGQTTTTRLIGACAAARVPRHASSIARGASGNRGVARAPRVPRARISPTGTTRPIGSSVPSPSTTPACSHGSPPASSRRWTAAADARSWRPAKNSAEALSRPTGGRRWTTRPRRSVQVRRPGRVYPPVAFADPTPRPLSDRRANDPAPRDRIWVFLSEEKRKNFLERDRSVDAFLFDRHEPGFHRSRPPFDRFQ